MDDTNGSYFFCFLLFHLILPLPHLFMSCFIPYAPLPLTLCCSLFHLSLLHPQSHSLPPTIPPHTSSPSLPLSLSLSLSLQRGSSASRLISRSSCPTPCSVWDAAPTSWITCLWASPGPLEGRYRHTSHMLTDTRHMEGGIMGRKAPGEEEHADGLVYFYLLFFCVWKQKRCVWYTMSDPMFPI